MRWRFVDRVTRFEPWKTIEGRKGISLEEFSLLKPFGRKGALPESLLLESCVQLARWLVVASSDFKDSVMLESIERFTFEKETQPGEIVEMAVVPGRVEPDGLLRVDTEMAAGGGCLSRGTLRLQRQPLAELALEDDMRTLWRELYGKA